MRRGRADGRGKCGAKKIKEASPPSLEGIRDYHEAANSRAPRFYIEGSEARTLLPTTEGSFFKLEGPDAQHALKVLRLRPGNLIELADGKGRLVTCEIESVGDRNSEAALRAVEDVRTEPWAGTRFELVVACADLQGSRADWLAEKAVELGAFALVPLLTERSGLGGKKGAPREDGKASIARAERWSRVAHAANQQSLRSHALQIREPVTVEQLANGLLPALSLLAAAGAPPLRDVIASNKASMKDGRVALIVGPPGDFTLKEVELLARAGALPVGLGDLRLRTETAALALLNGARLMLD